MPLIRENFIELEGSIQKTFDNFREQKKKYLDMMFNVSNSERSQENHYGLGAMGKMGEWSGQVDYEDIEKAYDNSYRHKKYSKGTKVEEALIRFKEYKEIKKRANKLAYTVDKTINYYAASTFNDAFTTTVTGPDSVSLCNAAHHIVPGDDAQSNTGNYDMSVDSIEEIKEKGRNFKDNKGDIMDINLSLIVCGTYWEKTAKQICGSDKEPYTADNQKNIYSDELTYMVNPHITGKKWFLAEPALMKGGEGLNWYWARDPYKVEYVDDFDTEVGKYKCVGWWSWGWDTWYWLFGCSPS
jgi:hypothetical protein